MMMGRKKERKAIVIILADGILMEENDLMMVTWPDEKAV